MEAETRNVGAARSGQSIHTLGIDLISHTSHAPPCIWAKCGLAKYRRGVQTCQPRLIARKRIALFRITVRSEATTPEQFWNTFGQRRGQSRDFLILRAPMLEAVGNRNRRGVSFAAALAAVLLVTFAFRAIAIVNATTVGFAYLITVLLVAASWGLAESVVASVTATICFSYFFLPPVGTLTIADPENWVALFAFLISSLIDSQLSDRAKRRTVEARTREIEMERLYALSRAIMIMDPSEPIGGHIARELARICEIPAVAIYDRHTDIAYYGGNQDITSFLPKLRETALTGSPSKEEPADTRFSPMSLAGQSIGSLAIHGGELRAPGLWPLAS